MQATLKMIKNFHIARDTKETLEKKDKNEKLKV